jgi:hypothetical protein
MSPGARFGGSVNSGAPKLANTLSLVVAGGGPKSYSTVTLFGVLAGDKAKDIDAKYGEKADADYHIILTKVMGDLKSVYGL